MPGQYNLYRYTNRDGSTKDWAVRVNGDGSYTTRWGRKGARLQSKTFRNVARTMQDHIREKTNKGYKLIGTVLIDDDGKVSPALTALRGDTIAQVPHPNQDEACIYWRVKLRQTSLADTQAIAQFKVNAYSMGKTIQSLLPDHEWIKGFSEKLIADQLPLSGKLHKNFGVSSLLLFMAMMKSSPSQVDIHLAHEDSVEISCQLKMESQALSFFDTDLESVRQIAEEIGLLQKRLDLSTIAPEIDDFYF